MIVLWNSPAAGDCSMIVGHTKDRASQSNSLATTRNLSSTELDRHRSGGH